MEIEKILRMKFRGIAVLIRDRRGQVDDREDPLGICVMHMSQASMLLGSSWLPT